MKEHSGKTLSIPPFTGETTSASASAAGQNLSGRSETTNRGPNITISGNGSSSADSPFSYGVSGSDSTENLVNFYNRERSQPRDEDSMSISSISSIASVEAARVGLGAVLVIGGIYACRKLIGK